MTKQYTEQVFRTSYRDDFRDSDNYHRVLFNSGRALQARELTQMQTIIQREISRLGNNIFKEGAMVDGGAIQINNSYEFVKIQGNNSVFDNVTNLAGVKLTGDVSGVVVQIFEAIAAEDGDPDTLYVQYLDNDGSVVEEPKRAAPGETLSNGSDINLVVQSIDNVDNRPVGKGSRFDIQVGSFFAQGHFVFADKQSIILSKYTNNYYGRVGFKVIQDIVTVADTDALYDNQGATPNRSSPGADRYRIRLELNKFSDVAGNENFVTLATIENGQVVTKATPQTDYNKIGDQMATRTFEESGNYIKRYFRAHFEPNTDDNFKLKVGPGTAYIKGYRINKDAPSTLIAPKAQSTVEVSDEQIAVDYGNYFEFDSGQGMLKFDECETVNLYSGVAKSGDIIGTARIRAIKEGAGSNFNAYLFDIDKTDLTYQLRDVRSIGSSTTSAHVKTVLTDGNAILREPGKEELILDTPILRPQSFEGITITVARRASFTLSSGTTKVFTATANESFVNEGDIIIGSPNHNVDPTASANITGAGNGTLTISNLSTGVQYDVLYYVRITNASVNTKTKTSATLTAASIDSAGDGVKYVSLGKSDIYSVSKIAEDSADGPNVFSNFLIDTGARDTHYDDGKLIWKGSGLSDSAGGVSLHVEYEYFAHTGETFFAANSYTDMEYVDIPAHRTYEGSLVSLRDVLDFRPATDGSGSFSGGIVCGLPQPTDTVTADATYYLPRNDKLVLSKDGEFRYLAGTSSLNPKYPSTPVDCIDLYKFELGANTLHVKDLKSTLLPLKGYTMEDINKIEKRLDKVEEMATLSLLELATQNLKVLDSDGVDRTKSGFLVDNFANHFYSDTTNPEYRASLDPRQKLVRPTFKEEAVDLYYDSEQSDQLRTIKKGDNIYLDYDEITYLVQAQASLSINVNPFFVEKNRGFIDLSPASDYWKESQKAAPRMIDGGTELDTRQALLWNNWEWNWNGTDVNDLQIGATSSNVTGTSTTTTVNTSEPRLTGTNVTEQVSDWVVTGTSSATSQLSSQDVVVSQDTEEVWRDVPDTDISATTRQTGVLDTVESTTTERRTEFETVNTTNLSQTTRVITENEFTTTTETTTNTSTTATVNRIASESTVREVVGSRVIDVAIIPFMRARKVSFKGTGLKPNTRYWPFFDGTDVSNFVKSEDWVTFSQRQLNQRNAGDTGLAEAMGTVRPTVGHSQTYSALVSDENGVVEGTFEIPNNSAMRFTTGTKEFMLIDISVYNPEDALSTAVSHYHAHGELETVQDTVRSTRILQVVGSQTTTNNVRSSSRSTVDTEVLIDERVATDVDIETTRSTVIGDRTTTSEVTASTPVTVNIPAPDPEPLPEPDWFPGEEDFWINEDFTDGGRRFADPLAQTFSVDDPNGVYITKVRVYFQQIESAGGFPIHCEIRPNTQGAPDSNKVVARTTLLPTECTLVPENTITSMVQNGTDFIFDEPVYLTGQSGFSVVLRSDSMNYKVYISEVENFVLGSTEKRVTKQPYLGSLFVSQNSKIWEPAQGQDLAMVLFRAQFATSGNAILENTFATPSACARNPFVATSGSSVVTVINRAHGLRPGDTVLIDGCGSDATDFGFTTGDFDSTHTVVDVDGSAFTIDAGTNATKSGRFGAGKVVITPNITFDTLRPQVELLQPETTNITLSGKFASASSLVNLDEGRYNLDTTYRLIPNKKNFEFDFPKAIYNKHNEERVAGLNGDKSAKIQVTMTTTDRRVSPVIDMQRAALICVGNLIDDQAETPTSGKNVPLRYVAETDPAFGTSLAKHLTTPVTLAEEATGLKILLAANRPPAANFDVYYRIADEGQNINGQSWEIVQPENTLPADTNKNVFREYRYLVGGIGGNADPFTQFQVKIVMRTTNSAKVPVLRDLRAIAMAV